MTTITDPIVALDEFEKTAEARGKLIDGFIDGIDKYCSAQGIRGEQKDRIYAGIVTQMAGVEKKAFEMPKWDPPGLTGPRSNEGRGMLGGAVAGGLGGLGYEALRGLDGEDDKRNYLRQLLIGSVLGAGAGSLGGIGLDALQGQQATPPPPPPPPPGAEAGSGNMFNLR